jgi:1,4-alpha-glucan branching enzyme
MFASDPEPTHLRSPLVLLNELDLHLFGEGTHRRLWEWLGAHVLPEGGVRFAVWAPNAREVWVVGDWNGWGSGTRLDRQDESGVWAGIVAEARPGQFYKFAVVAEDGQTTLKADPMAFAAQHPPENASVITAPRGHEWGDEAWVSSRSCEPGDPLRIYEVHLGSWRQGLRWYRDLAPALADHVSALGFTHIELLPIAEHPYTPSWGYQVTGYYAPTARHGSPDDFRSFVDTMHQRGIGVIVDWVPAHFPRDRWALVRFDGTPQYEHPDPRLGEHPDWGTLIFDYGRNEVRNFLVANALYWMEEFHIDGLRVDAVASMLYLDYSRAPGEWVPNRLGGRENLEAIDFLRTLTTTVAAEAPGTMVIAEESTAWPGVSHPVSEGGLGFTHKWNMGWMHDTLRYFATEPIHRRWRHHDVTFGLLYAFSERFVLPLSHDEVVHLKGSLLRKMVGDDWQRFANLRALYAWMWAMPGAPLLFMGAELAPWNEWNENVGLPWHLLEQPEHRGVRDLLTELNRIAVEWPALWERDDEEAGFQWLAADEELESVFAFLRWGASGERSVACVANFTPVPRPGFRVGLPWAGRWEVLVDTDAPVFGGSAFRDGAPQVVATADVPYQGQPYSAQVDLPPLGVLWLGAARPA